MMWRYTFKKIIMGKFIVAVLNFLLTVTFPALLVLILLIIIFFFYRKKIARYLLAIVIILFYFIANGIIPQLLIRPLEANLRPISKNVILQHHTMVVLGSGITHSARYFIPGLFSYSRIVTAAKIYQIGKQNGINYTIFLSGGATSKKQPH